MSAFGDMAGKVAAVILAHNPKTVSGIQAAYDAASNPAQPRVRILVVAGHEPDYGGAEYRSEYGTVRERDLTVELADSLAGLLRSDSRFMVFTTRTTDAWTPTFASYFNSQFQDIIAWRKAYKAETESMIQVGQFTETTPVVYHNKVPDGPAIRLFGIDKWADENNIDIVIHVHFNDYPRTASEEGKYSGFAIYVPEKQYDNSSSTKVLAQAVFDRLKKYNPVSDMPQEKGGIIEDQDLIAIGPFNSVNAPSMLVEYSYIYEPQLVNPATQKAFIDELAYETYKGVGDFLDPGVKPAAAETDTLMLPHHWDTPLTGKNDDDRDVFALQTALIADGDYPPAGKTMNDCPRTGGFGGCTRASLQEFQDKYGISGEKGIAGPKTLERLNDLFSLRIQPL